MSRYAGIVLCLAIALPALGQAAPEQPWPPIPDEEEHSILFRSRAGFEPPADWFKPRLTPLHWDVLHYDISLDVNVAGREIEGTVVATIESLEDGLETIVLDLYDNMEVHWVRTDGIDLDFSRGGNQLQITLARERSTGEEFDVEIRYGGSPTVTGLGSFRFRTHASGPIVSSLSEPEGARTWWPCRDVPYDKTTMSMHLTVPDPLVGVSNGTLVGIDSADNKLTYHWVEEYPIATYLVSVAVSNYVSWSETYTPPSGPTMEVWYWVYPHHENEAREDFNVTVPMMEFYSELFGEYPFLSEKYGMAEFPCWCAMEHQTASSYGDNFVRGDHRYDWIVAHELAHQWWGDLVTLGTWKDMWLNEGFTTYSEPLWFSRNDPPRYRAYMNGLDGGPFEGTVYDPDELFGRTVYHKGAWVLHMLRHVVGDDPFFDLLRDWAQSYAYQSPETWQFQELAETYYEDPLDPRLGLGWFFDEWVYGPGRPDYRWGWLASEWEGSWNVHVRVEQAQIFDPFRMPLDVRIDHPSGPTTHVAWNDSRVQDYVFSMDEGPVDLELDPDDWVLKHSSEIHLPDPDGDGIPDWADGCPDSYNPGQEDSDGDTIQDACDPAEDSDGDTVANDRDCADGDPLVWELPGEATGLRFEGGREGVMVWDQYDPINAQDISYDSIRGDLADLLALGTTEQAHCLFRATQWPEQVDRDTPGGAGRVLYYLVRARNSCGGGPWGPETHERIRLNLACQ